MMKLLTAFTALLLVSQTVAAKEYPLEWWKTATAKQVEAELKSGAMNVKKAAYFDDLPLKAAVEACASPEVLKVLIKHGADLNNGITENATGDSILNPTPLGSAHLCPSEVMKTLIDAGAHLDVSGEEGNTFLMSIVSYGKDPAIVPYLIKKGVPYKAEEEWKDGELQSWTGEDADGNHVLMHALSNENPVLMIDALLESGVDINMLGHAYYDNKYHPVTVLDYLEQTVKEGDSYHLIKVDAKALYQYLVSKGAKHASEL